MERKIAVENLVEPISHDGLHDSLTHLPASSYFYELLMREMARAERESKPLLLIQFNLELSHKEHSPKECEYLIINFSSALMRSSRASDVCARIGRFQFLSLVSIEPPLLVDFLHRVKGAWRGEACAFRYSSTAISRPESIGAILKRLNTAESILL
jgi:hypothetical protein